MQVGLAEQAAGEDDVLGALQAVHVEVGIGRRGHHLAEAVGVLDHGRHLVAGGAHQDDRGIRRPLGKRAVDLDVGPVAADADDPGRAVDDTHRGLLAEDVLLVAQTAHLSTRQHLPVAAVELRQHDQRSAGGDVGFQPGAGLSAGAVAVEASAGHDDHRRRLEGRQVAAVWQTAAAGAGHDLDGPGAHAEASNGADGRLDETAVHYADPARGQHLAQLVLQLQLLAAQEVVLEQGKVQAVQQRAALLAVVGLGDVDQVVGVGRAHGVGDGLARLGQDRAADQSGDSQVGLVVGGVQLGRVADGAAGVHLEGGHFLAAQLHGEIGRGAGQPSCLRSGHQLLQGLDVAADAARVGNKLALRGVDALVGVAVGRRRVGAVFASAATSAAATAAAGRVGAGRTEHGEHLLGGAGGVEDAVDADDEILGFQQGKDRVEDGRGFQLQGSLAAQLHLQLGVDGVVAALVGLELEGQHRRKLRTEEPGAGNGEVDSALALQFFGKILGAKSDGVAQFLGGEAQVGHVLLGLVQRLLTDATARIDQVIGQARAGSGAESERAEADPLAQLLEDLVHVVGLEDVAVLIAQKGLDAVGDHAQPRRTAKEDARRRLGLALSRRATDGRREDVDLNDLDAEAKAGRQAEGEAKRQADPAAGHRRAQRVVDRSDAVRNQLERPVEVQRVVDVDAQAVGLAAVGGQAELVVERLRRVQPDRDGLLVDHHAVGAEDLDGQLVLHRLVHQRLDLDVVGAGDGVVAEVVQRGQLLAVVQNRLDGGGVNLGAPLEGTDARLLLKNGRSGRLRGFGGQVGHGARQQRHIAVGRTVLHQDALAVLAELEELLHRGDRRRVDVCDMHQSRLAARLDDARSGGGAEEVVARLQVDLGARVVVVQAAGGQRRQQRLVGDARVGRQQAHCGQLHGQQRVVNDPVRLHVHHQPAIRLDQ